MRNIYAVSPPMVLHGTTHILVQSTKALFGYQIPVEGDSSQTAKVCLLSGIFGFGAAQAYGFHRGVGLSSHDTLTFSDYRWPGEEASAENPSAGCRHHAIKRLDNFRGGRMVLDQYSNCAVVVDSYASNFFFVSLSD
jgi:hypothetical protein